VAGLEGGEEVEDGLLAVGELHATFLCGYPGRRKRFLPGPSRRLRRSPQARALAAFGSGGA
jgi:hypothetical protein